MRLVTVKKCFVKGTAADFKEKNQNTSYIEPFNLTLRQRVSYCKEKPWVIVKRNQILMVPFGLISMTTTIGANIKA
jgi:hypothetical protein